MSRQQRCMAWIWVAYGAATLLVEFYAAAISSAPYSFMEQTISDLALTTCGPVHVYPSGPVEICSPAHDLVNGVWIVSGIAFAVAALLLRPCLGPGRIIWAGTLLNVLTGLLVTGVGLVPANVNLLVHAIVALAGMIAQNIALILLGRGLRAHRPRLSTAGLIAGAIGLVGTALLIAPTSWSLPFGLVERIALYPHLLWVIAAGLVLARHRNPARTDLAPIPAPRS